MLISGIWTNVFTRNLLFKNIVQIWRSIINVVERKSCAQAVDKNVFFGNSQYRYLWKRRAGIGCILSGKAWTFTWCVQNFYTTIGNSWKFENNFDWHREKKWSPSTFGKKSALVRGWVENFVLSDAYGEVSTSPYHLCMFIFIYKAIFYFSWISEKNFFIDEFDVVHFFSEVGKKRACVLWVGK